MSVVRVSVAAPAQGAHCPPSGGGEPASPAGVGAH